MMNLYKVISFVLIFTVGITFGFMMQSKHNKVYILDEARFLSLCSMGLSSNIDTKERDGVKSVISKLKDNLNKKYTKYPVLIQKKQGKAFEIYSKVEKVDITNDIIRQTIGETSWQNIGKTFLK